MFVCLFVLISQSQQGFGHKHPSKHHKQQAVKPLCSMAQQVFVRLSVLQYADVLTLWSLCSKDHERIKLCDASAARQINHHESGLQKAGWPRLSNCLLTTVEAI